MKLQSFLARLIWICIAPLLALAALMAVQALLEHDRRRSEEATDLANSVAAIVDRHLGSRVGALQTLAASPALDDRQRWGEFYSQAQSFREAFGSHVVLSNAAGEMLLNTRIPLGAKLPPMPKVQGTAAAPTALATGRPAVGDQFMGPVAKQPLIAIGVPVARAAVPGHVLVTTIEATQFQQRLDELALPAAWAVRLLDGNGAVIAQHPDRDLGHARTERFVARPPSTGWTVTIDVPTGLSDRTAVRTAVLLGVIILAATLVGVVGGRVAAGALSRSLESLAQETVPSAAAASRAAPEIAEVSRIRRLLFEAAQQRVAGEVSLRSSEERFRRVFERAPLPLAFSDTAGRIVAVNLSFRELFGYERTDVPTLEAWWSRAFPDEEDRAHARSASRAAMKRADAEAGAVPSEQFRVICKDGTERTVVIAWIMLDGGVLASFSDVTEARRMDAELDRHRHHLEQLVAQRTEALAAANRELAQRAAEIADLYDRAPCGYHSLALDGTILSANRTELAMLGYAREEYVGHRITEFMTAESVEAFRSRFAEFQRTGRARDLAYDAVRKDGTILPVLVSADMIRDEHGKPLYNRATMVDDSERRSRERKIASMQVELARRAEAAEAANVAKSAFLANMSHEIRTPMNAILGFAQILRRGQLGAEQRERIDKINAAGEHLLAIINDILDLSKIDAGKLQLEMLDFPLAAVLDGVRSLISEGAQRKGIAVELDYDDVPVWLNGDPTRLRQCLLNLAGNAVKFTERGRIVLRSKLVEGQGDDLLVRFEVEDTGIGIAPDKVDQLFQPFQQVDSATTRRYGGTGLGLAITLRLAELMGGRAGVESRQGEGSRFWFTARVARAVAPRPASIASKVTDAESALRARHSGARVLLAEDDPVNQEVAVALLGDAGLHVDVAENGRQAVEKVGRVAYDLVLMDMQMPVMDGLAATRAIRGLAGGGAVPIIALTANAFDEDRRRCREAGMSGFVVKPFEPDDLFRTILEGLEASRRQA